MDISKQAANKVLVDGVLQEVDIKTGKLESNGKEYIAGTIVVRVPQAIDGMVEEHEIPISVFATKKTNKGADNPAYSNIKKLSEDFISMAADSDKADKVSINAGQLFENKFVGKDGKFISGFRIRNAFFTKITKNYEPRAVFKATIVIISMKDELDREGEPTGRLAIRGALVQYGGKVDVLDFVVAKPDVKDYIENHWNKNDTVRVGGRVRFVSETVASTKGSADSFGEDIPESYNRVTRELIVTTGSTEALDDEESYDILQIDTALKARKAEIDKLQADAASKPASSTVDLSAGDDF